MPQRASPQLTDEEEKTHTPHDTNQTNHKYGREQPFATPQNHSAEGTTTILKLSLLYSDILIPKLPHCSNFGLHPLPHHLKSLLLLGREQTPIAALPDVGTALAIFFGTAPVDGYSEMGYWRCSSQTDI